MGRYISIIFIILFLTACEATPIKDAGLIRTRTLLKQDIQLPISTPVAYYVSKAEAKTGYNFFSYLDEALELVLPSYFSESFEVARDKAFAYLLKFNSESEWDRAWGGWRVTLYMDVVSPTGEVVYKGSYAKKGSSGSGFYDESAIYNAYAGAIKESVNRFFNQQGAAKLADATVPMSDTGSELNLKTLFDGLEPGNTGTGFYIDLEGKMVTASHVVDECLYIEVHQKGETFEASVLKNSKLLDLAVLEVESRNTHRANIGHREPYATLGKQVFVTGFPLSGILSDYPSLTVGNVSSLGGLKGAKGHFQFSAPVQPGNSGGAIVDYKGNLVGVVSSSLNQEMLLKQTGTTAQNVNFGVSLPLLKKFLDKQQVSYPSSDASGGFETSSANAVEYTAQVLCYQ